MCPDAVEEEHTYNDTITPSRVYNHGLSMALLPPLAPPIHFTPFRRQVRPSLSTWCRVYPYLSCAPSLVYIL